MRWLPEHPLTRLNVCIHRSSGTTYLAGCAVPIVLWRMAFELGKNALKSMKTHSWNAGLGWTGNRGGWRGTQVARSAQLHSRQPSREWRNWGPPLRATLTQLPPPLTSPGSSRLACHLTRCTSPDVAQGLSIPGKQMQRAVKRSH